MIKSIEIENFRGIQQGKLDDLTPLTILVGPNGCGKSTVLDAMLLAASPIKSEAIKVLYEHRLRIKGGVRWLLWKADTRIEASIQVVEFPGESKTIYIEGSGGLPERPILSFTASSGTKSNGAIQKEQIGSATETGFSYNPPSAEQFGRSVSVTLVDQLIEPYRLSLHGLFTAAVRQGRRTEVNDSVRAVLAGVDHLEILTEGDVPVIHLVYPTYSVPASLSGEGIHDLLRICLELASRPDGVVLLEEPEVHQHPGALRQTARAILAAVRRGIQVVLTTHDLELIDFLLSETESDEELERISVRRLQLKDGCLRSSNLTGAEASLSRSAIQDDLR